MNKLTATVQSGDWKAEKHVPTIHAEKKDGIIEIIAEVGEDIPHPNTLEHHIGWIKVFFQPEGAKFPHEVGSFEFTVHGEEELFTKPIVKTEILTEKKGTIYAMSYCNIHGLWENAVEI